jgi:uncharacterized SAM-binding protein YcdF (DUF218 family)
MARLLSLLVILWALGFALFALTLPRPASDTLVTDGIVVLTGGAGRLERGVSLLAAHRAKRLFVSGADRTVRKAELAARTHSPQALFDCCVDLGQDSVDTRSNARETADWVRSHDIHSLRLVTTDWHMPRAHADLNRALGGTHVRVVPDAVRSEPGFATLFTEYHKYVLRRVAAPFGY